MIFEEENILTDWMDERYEIRIFEVMRREAAEQKLFIMDE